MVEYSINTKNPHKVIVTPELRETIKQIKDGQPWRVFEELDAWGWSHTLAWKIAHGHVHTCDPNVYRALGLTPPSIVHLELPQGMSLFTEDNGLLDIGSLAIIRDQDNRDYAGILVLPANSIKQIEIRPCAVTDFDGQGDCQNQFATIYWSNQRYCRECRQSGRAARWRAAQKQGAQQ